MDPRIATSSLLEKPTYSLGEAARLLRIPTAKLRRWLDGYERRGVTYQPIIRPASTGSDVVTWGEFIEAGFLREYRELSALHKIRQLVDDLRKRHRGVLHPLAEERPYVDMHSRDLFLKVQDAGGPRLLQRAPRSHESGMQMIWADPVRQFLDKVAFNDVGAAYRYYPLKRPGLVTIDPEVSFGIPHVHGIRTERLVESHDAGESVVEIAEAWRISLDAVEQALRWERELLAA